MITTVLLDFVNTIGFLDPSREEILEKFCKVNNLNLPDLQKVRKAFLLTDNCYPYSSVNISRFEQKQEFYSQYNKELFKNLNLTNSEGFFSYYHLQSKSWKLDDEVPPLFEFLKSSNIKVGVLSNFDKNLESILDELNILDQLDYLHVSQSVGIEKPDPLFYKSAIKKYNIDTSTALYIGDSYFLDYIPAQVLG